MSLSNSVFVFTDEGDCVVTETFGSSWSANVNKNYKISTWCHLLATQDFLRTNDSVFHHGLEYAGRSNAFYMPFCFFTLWLVAKQLWAASCTICNVLNWPAKIWNLYALWFACCWLINCCLIVFYHDPIPYIYNSRIEPIQCMCMCYCTAWKIRR